MEREVGFNLGIIGLPNVGKSTIFNALAGAGAEMANYPFCTIEPNRGVVPVPDDRLDKIAHILQKENPIPTKVHVVRLFHRGDVVHMTGNIDPIRDVEIVKTELILSDLEILERSMEKQQKLARGGDKEAKKRLEIIEKAIPFLNEGKLLKGMDMGEDELVLFRELGLISIKPVLFCANIDEDAQEDEQVSLLEKYARVENCEFLGIIGKLEEEISELPSGEKEEYLKGMGISESGLDRLIKASYRLLDLIAYFTAATQLQAWTLKRGTRALEAAGRIHTDFERGFIRAEVYTYEDLLREGSEHLVREKGRLRSEGKDYIVQDGDIIRFFFNI